MLLLLTNIAMCAIIVLFLPHREVRKNFALSCMRKGDL